MNMPSPSSEGLCFECCHIDVWILQQILTWCFLRARDVVGEQLMLGGFGATCIPAWEEQKQTNPGLKLAVKGSLGSCISTSYLIPEYWCLKGSVATLFQKKNKKEGGWGGGHKKGKKKVILSWCSWYKHEHHENTGIGQIRCHLPQKCPKFDGECRLKYSNAAWSSVCCRRGEGGVNSFLGQDTPRRLTWACAWKWGLFHITA